MNKTGHPKEDGDAVKMKLCPKCKKMKPMTHFYACLAGSSGGGCARGEKKVRGNSNYYSYLGRIKAEKNRKEKTDNAGLH